jgi:hypothetical protein
MSAETDEQTACSAFTRQAVWCDGLGSPFTAQLMRAAARTLDPKTAAGRTILEWGSGADALGDAVPLRLAGALHALVRRGVLPELARLYPPNPMPPEDALAKSVAAAISDQDDEICQWLKHAPQTNEVARSAVIYPALIHVASISSLPLALFELGASAGLNLAPQLIRYEFGAGVFGDEGSPLTLAPEWSGPVPVGAAPEVVASCGCDLNPLDITRSADAERLMAYLWPDQTERLARTETAIVLMRARPPRIDCAEAAQWVDAMLAQPAAIGQTRVFFHTIAHQYFPAETQHRIQTALNAAGTKARHDAPLAHISFEQHGNDGPRLRVTIWPEGETRVLARADAHARRVTWLADS